MVERGGPAAINGFLYQILSHLGWLASVRMTGQISAADVVDDACIILEPKDGGDARIEASGLYLVEQYKVRPNSTWSVQAIIHDVLPDLRKAVREPPTERGRYRFVTDGRKGRLKSFEAFLLATQTSKEPADLDAAELHHFGENLPNNFRDLFSHIVKATRSASEPTRNDEPKAVFHLLQNFEMEFNAAPDRCITSIEMMIRPICKNLGDEGGKRQQLVGMLMERLATGEARLRPQDVDKMLVAADLEPDRLHNLARLRSTLASLLNDELERRDYHPESDVRQPPVWRADAPVLLIAGRSGEGKTWQLAKLACAEANAQQPVVWISGAMDTSSTLTRAMRVVWQDGLGATDDKSPGAITLHYRQMAPNAPLPWLTIAIDDVQDPDLARDLINQPWERWGMRLAMSLPSSVAVSARETVKGIQIHTVTRFSVSEIDDLLARKGRIWSGLPSDLQQWLRMPILAGLYLRLPYNTFSSAPKCEYEIFDAFWERMCRVSKSGDDGVLLGIASKALEGASYPIERDGWQLVGLNENCLERLIAAGWLNCLPGGRVSFAHDRLLNWAVSVFIQQQVANSKLTAEQLAELLLRCCDSSNGQLPKSLAYVPLDLLWLLTGSGIEARAIVDLLVRLETSPHYGGYGQDLYTHLLPTLGERAIEPLKARLEQLGEREYQVQLIADALANIARQSGVDLSSLTEHLLWSVSEKHQFVGMSLAATKPSSRFLPRLWELNKERWEVLHRAPQDHQNYRWNHLEYDTSYAALRAGVRADPGWLQQRIRVADPQHEPVYQLAYLLNTLEHPRARDVWFDVKDELIAKVPPDRPRSLLYCIGRFHDLSQMDFVLACLTRKEDWANGAALSNLVKLDPDLAVEKLADIYAPDLAMSRNWWLPQLLHARPADTRRKLLSIARSQPKGRRIIEDLFADRPNQLDVPMLLFHLRTLEAELQIETMSAREGHPWITFPLRLLCGISQPDLLSVLLREAGGSLEQIVTEIACARVQHVDRHSDHVLEACRQFLTNVNGSGITQLVNCELRSSTHLGRIQGLRSAVVSFDPETINLLRVIGRRPVPSENDGAEKSKEWYERYMATIALAAAGSDDGVLESIWGDGPEAVATDLVNLRAQNGPLAKAVTAHAFDVLSNTGATQAELLKALAVAWLSMDTEFILPVRNVLACSAPDSQLAGMACIALHSLRDRSAHFRQLALRLLQTERNASYALNALLSVGDAAVPDLAAYLHNLPLEKWSRNLGPVVEALHHGEETRATVIGWIVRLFKKHPHICPSLSIAVESGDGEVRERVTEMAFRENSALNWEKVHTIEALAKFDIVRAVQAAEKQLYVSRNELRPLALLLTRLSPDDAALRLVNVARERKDSLTAAGHALRRLDSEQVDEILLRCVRDPSSNVRTVGAQLIGWLPPDRLISAIEDMLREETEDAPRWAALEALDRKNQQTVSLNLLRLLAVEQNDRCWPILLALLRTADPHLLTDRHDPLWIGPVLDQKPHVFRYYTRQELQTLKAT